MELNPDKCKSMHDGGTNNVRPEIVNGGAPWSLEEQGSLAHEPKNLKMAAQVYSVVQNACGI